MVHVPCDRSCHKEYTCAMLKPYRFWFESNAKVKVFFKSRSNFKVKVNNYINLQYFFCFGSLMRVQYPKREYVLVHMVYLCLYKYLTNLFVCPVEHSLSLKYFN